MPTCLRSRTRGAFILRFEGLDTFRSRQYWPGPPVQYLDLERHADTRVRDPNPARDSFASRA